MAMWKYIIIYFKKKMSCSPPYWQPSVKFQLNAQPVVSLYDDCPTPIPPFINSLENPNAVIPRGIFFFFRTIYLAMIYWLWLPPSQRITDPFWEIRFSHLECVCGPGLQRLWEETDFEKQWCVNLYVVTRSAANGMLCRLPCDSLPPSPYYCIINWWVNTVTDL